MLPWLLGGLYIAILMVLAVYGFHRSYLVYKCWSMRDRLDELKRGVPALPLESFANPESIPRVTVQLPLFNEATVAPRLLEYVARLEYPRERLEIQVLDD